MSKTIWYKKIGFQFGDLDGVQHTSEKSTNDNGEDDGQIRKRRTVILIGKAESNYPIDCVMYVFFCFRLIIGKN